MKLIILLLLLSLFALSCNKYSDSDYLSLSKKYEDKTKEIAEKNATIDSLFKDSFSKNHIATKIESTKVKQKEVVKSTNNITKDDKYNLLQNKFFKKYEYVNSIEITPKLFFITVSRNNTNKNFICQLLESIDGSSSKFIFTPTNKSAIDILDKYKKEEPNEEGSIFKKRKRR